MTRFRIVNFKDENPTLLTFRSKKYGNICLSLPYRCYGYWVHPNLYCSPSFSIFESTFLIGGYNCPDEKYKSKLRRLLFGHNFDIYECDDVDYRHYDIYQRIKETPTNELTKILRDALKRSK